MDNRIIKLIICPKCKGWISAGAWEHFTEKDKRDFMKDAAKYDGDVMSVTKDDFQDMEACKLKCD